jgi:5-methylcytosine-specific restriction protein A
MGERILGRRLQEIRALHRMVHGPFCVHCLARGVRRVWTELDHIQPLKADGGTGEDVPENRQGLCAECHAAKTRADRGLRPRPRIGEDGYPVAR